MATAAGAVPLRFDDAAAYEAMMGVWSRLAGETFLDWLAAPPRRDWIDIGCGNGAFTELIVDRCDPRSVTGIDLSEAQIAYAQGRPAARLARFDTGDAQALAVADAAFDVAVMALVIFFLPDPARGAAEMRRVLRPGGLAAAYVWDVAAGASPIDPIRTVMRQMGLAPVSPPSAQTAEADRLAALWTATGFDAVETRTITVSRSFESFEAFWEITLAGSILGPQVAALLQADRERLEQGVRAALPSDTAGRINYSSRANAVKGHLPG